MNENSHVLKNIPGVDKVLHHKDISGLSSSFSQEFITYNVRQVIAEAKNRAIIENSPIPVLDEFVSMVVDRIHRISGKSLKKVINCSGIVIHTNIGRAPLGSHIIEEVADIIDGYNNLEFDLGKCERGSRHDHPTGLLKYLTGAEDVMVVNNNAAALMLILRTFSKEKKTIVSRGELIEIGGSFRLPDIMKASDAIMIEVGTTNKTRPADYQLAIDDSTGLLLKAHQSNYTIEGFTEEVSIGDLVKIGKKNGIPVVYDMGSGLFRKSEIEVLKDEPIVKEAVQSGLDMICFSGDKLLGGPQAGIIAGKMEYISRLKKEPLSRALRVDKVTLALLEAVCSKYLNEETLHETNAVFEMLLKTPLELKSKAESLKQVFADRNINTEIVPNKAKSGGGSLPGKEIDSFALKLIMAGDTKKQLSKLAERIHRRLLSEDIAVLGILRKGNVYFDVLTLQEDDFETVANQLQGVLMEVTG